MAAVNLIGLDIGTVSIRAAETSNSKDGPVISNFGHILLPPGVVQNGAVQDERAATGALKQLWATFKFRSRKVALGVTHQQIVVRETTVANLPAKDMRKALPFQVRDALPLPSVKVCPLVTGVSTLWTVSYQEKTYGASYVIKDHNGSCLSPTDLDDKNLPSGDISKGSTTVGKLIVAPCATARNCRNGTPRRTSKIRRP
jgi:hypothetical protein